MAFKKGVSGHKAGRPKGIKDKRWVAADVIQTLKANSCNPFELMAQWATDEKVDMNIRYQCAKELAKYVAPQLKAVAVAVQDEDRNKQLYNINLQRQQGVTYDATSEGEKDEEASIVDAASQ